MHCFLNASFGGGDFTKSLALLHLGIPCSGAGKDTSTVRRSTPKSITAFCTGAG
uniref:Uncharacterized protein n=1 Tax=Triticum urartu TaxID=4572 RepID=A0A8R7TNU2_TRIUA